MQSHATQNHQMLIAAKTGDAATLRLPLATAKIEGKDRLGMAAASIAASSHAITP